MTKPIVRADELSQHLNLVEPDGATWSHLEQLSSAAQAAVFAHTGDFSDNDPPEVPADVRHAIMMLASHFYLNREATSPESFSTIPFGVWDLIEPYRQRAFG